MMPFSRLVRFCFPSHRCLWMFVLLWLAPIHASAAQDSKPKFRVVALAEHGGIHQTFVDAAKVWLQKLATDSTCGPGSHNSWGTSDSRTIFRNLPPRRSSSKTRLIQR